MFFKASIVAFALATVSNAHMIMTSPIPYGVDSLNSSPLALDGSDFPCKQRTGVYEVTTQNTMDLGGSYELAFKGSAVHGGGSCQVSITYDENPTASSTFKVIHSIIGGCPMKNIAGNNGDNANTIDPDTYNFTIPTTLPAGKATLAWTWFNKVGNREMYMNCAPVTLTGGSSKRSDLIARDQAAFNALPDMFTANIDNGGCSTKDSTDLVFPNPGDSVEYDEGSTTATAGPTGSCATAAGGAATAKPTGTGTGATSAAAPYGTTPASTASSLPGGFFISIATGTGAATSAATLTATLTATSAAGTISAIATTAVSVPTTPTSVTSAVAPAGTGSSSTSSSGALTGACTSEGMFNCISGTSYQQCGSGTWSVVMQMASGTTCTSGQTMNMVIAKRNGMGLMRHVALRGLGAEMFN
ncbi:hypothetical protein BOTCAL_0025g00260 [Botryotinia calthae]|uniref:Chitin-binding type-4 domain-containing protein n=1 Tax=Botryotinia calthae TaxID=38488 RepID=A0A4Y8DGG9_9HELO|nr:hypothetical protein BOTCAL_0025g00260 [Botryotinia calthae]